MIVYFADRDLNLKGQASTSLLKGLRLFDDLTSEDIDSGVNTFSGRVTYDNSTRADLEAAIQPGRFILKSGGRGFNEIENNYDSLYQIIDTEFDTEAMELYFYAEDAGLDLINKVVPAMTFTDNTLTQMLREVLANDWTLNLVGTPTGTKTYTWDGENTATERINSIVGLFGCEAYYSFEIERFEVKAKVLNVVVKRGNQAAIPQLRLNKDINKIVTKSSIADLATAYAVTGGTPDNSDTPINLKGYSYSRTDPDTGDLYQVDTATGQMRNVSAMQRWSSALDTDGLVVKQYTFDTADKATLAGEAAAELKNHCDMLVNYEVDFVSLPEDARIGDRINIIDEQGELYLEARLLKIETSVANGTQTATIGDYLIKAGGIAEIVAFYAKDFAGKDGLNAVTLTISSSGGNVFHNVPIETTLLATVFNGTDPITNQQELEGAFGSGAMICWYQENELIAMGFSLRVESESDKEVIKVRLITS